MIGYIKGKLLSANNGVVILENNGIGYEITLSGDAYSKIVNDKGGEVYTYLSVREDGISLFGFNSIEEKNMFLKLISVSGVGPKMGITVLSNMTLKDLATKIATSDVKGLSQVKGLGKKTAERIILELREKMDEQLSQDTSPIKPVVEDKDFKDALLALTGLGFDKSESLAVLEKAQIEDVKGVQALIAYSLKNIRK